MVHLQIYNKHSNHSSAVSQRSSRTILQYSRTKSSKDPSFEAFKMAILLTGGTGKTSTRLAKLLQDAKIPFLLTSRKGQAGAPSGMEAVKFVGSQVSQHLGQDLSSVRIGMILQPTKLHLNKNFPMERRSQLSISSALKGTIHLFR